jgi:hypothetical protein
VALDVLHGRGPAIRLFKVAAEAASKRDVCAGLVTGDRELEFSIWAFCRSRPNVEGDLRVWAGKKKSLSILLGELPPFGERALGISARRNEIGMLLLAPKESHCGSRF